MDTRPFVLLLVALLARALGEGACPVPATAPSIFSLALDTLEAVLEEVPGDKCRRQVTVFLEGLHNLTDWALHMADATTKMPAGLLRGNLRALGDVDECVAVEAEVEAAAETIRGKYCLASVHVDSDSAPVARLLDVATGGRRHLEFRHRRVDLGGGVAVASPGFVPELSRAEWGVCAPAACSPADVEAALRGVARRLLPSLRLHVRVPPLACRTHDAPARPLSAAHYAFAILIGIFVTLAIIGTTWDNYSEDETADESSPWRAVLRAFSLRSGWKRLTSERAQELGCVAGMRALSTIVAVFAHESLFFAQEPSINKTKIVQATTKIYYTPVMTSIMIVETFFTISGTLYSYSVANSVINGSFSYIMTLILRFMRLSPVYYLLIWFYTTFLEYLGDGPNWANFITYDVESCRENWIWNILYISNYANNLSVCMVQSWSLAADMQLVALAPLVVLPLYRWRKGRHLLLALIALSVATTAATVVFLRIPGIYRVFDTDLQIVLYLQNSHSRTHMHASPFLVGLFLGYILHKIKNKRLSLNKGFLTLGWAVSLLMFLANSVGPNYMLQDSYEYNPLDSAAYPAIGRLLWAVGVSWIIFTCHTGCGGLLNRLLNCYVLRVLSRLSYLVNMTHFILLLHNGGRRRTPIWIDEFTWIQIFIADYVLATAISFVLYLLIDSPISLIIRSFLFKGASTMTNVTPLVPNENKKK